MKKNRNGKAHAPKRELSPRSDEVKIHPDNTTVSKNRQPARELMLHGYIGYRVGDRDGGIQYSESAECTVLPVEHIAVERFESGLVWFTLCFDGGAVSRVYSGDYSFTLERGVTDG